MPAPPPFAQAAGHELACWAAVATCRGLACLVAMLAELAIARDLLVGVRGELCRCGEVGLVLKHLTASETDRLLRRELAGLLEHPIDPVDQRGLAAHEVEDEAATDVDRVVHDVTHPFDHTLPCRHVTLWLRRARVPWSLPR